MGKRGALQGLGPLLMMRTRGEWGTVGAGVSQGHCFIAFQSTVMVME